MSNSSDYIISGATDSTVNLHMNRGLVVTGDAYVYSGDVANNMILANGTQFVSGGTAISTVITSGNQSVVSSGSVIITNITSGTQFVSGGNATSTTISNGSQSVADGSAISTLITSGDQEVYKGGSVYNTSINTGTQILFGGVVTDTIINNGIQVINVGTVSNVSINNGYQKNFAGTVSNVSITNGAQFVYGGSISGTVYLGNNASQEIMSYTDLSNFTVTTSAGNYGFQNINREAVVSNITLGPRITQTVYIGGTVNGVTMTQQNIQNIYGGIVSNTSLASGSLQSITNGEAVSTNIVNGAYQLISGGYVSNTNISGGGIQTIFARNVFGLSDASVVNTIVSSGGIQNVSGGFVVSTSINSGGIQNIFDTYTGSVTDTSITSGTQNVLRGSVNSTYFAGGTQNVSSGAVVYNTSLTNNASQFVFSGAIASNTIISGGYQSIYSGAVASDTTVTDGSVYAGDGANLGNVTINNGGYLDVSVKTNIQGNITLSQGGSAQLTTSNGGAINLVGDDNGGLTIIGDPSIVGTDPNTSVTTQIQGFTGTDSEHSDTISLQYDGLKTGKLSSVTYSDENHITLTMDTGFALTLNIVGIKQTGYSIKESTDGVSGLILTVCFLSGTQIKTKLGVKNIEALQVGDFVTTYDWVQKKYVEREVTWVGKKYCRVNTSLPDDMAGYPVRVVKDAIAKGVPYKDLLITAEHCLFFEDKFIPSRMLVNGKTIHYDYSITSYEYYHLETQDHAVIIADGVRTESYLDTGNRHAFNHDQKIIETSFQSAKDWTVDAAAPLEVSRETVEPLYNKLNKRAQRLKADYKGRHVQLVNDSDLHLVTDQGQVIRNKRVSGEWVTFMVPSTAKSVWINSKRSRLCDVIGPFVDNRHFLGVLVGEVMIFADNKNELSNILREEEELEGWHAKEKKAGRWTKGRALLPIKSKHLVDNSVIYISLQILSEGPYVELVTEDADEVTLVG